jgi:hypothetical protein
MLLRMLNKTLLKTALRMLFKIVKMSRDRL